MRGLGSFVVKVVGIEGVEEGVMGERRQEWSGLACMGSGEVPNTGYSAPEPHSSSERVRGR